MWQHAFQKASVAPVNLKSAWCEVLQCWLTHWLIRVDDIGTSVTSKQGQLRGKLDQGHWPRWRLVALGAVSLAEGPELELPRPGLPWPQVLWRRFRCFNRAFRAANGRQVNLEAVLGFSVLPSLNPKHWRCSSTPHYATLCDFTKKKIAAIHWEKNTSQERQPSTLEENLPPWRKTFHLGKPSTLEKPMQLSDAESESQGCGRLNSNVRELKQ